MTSKKDESESKPAAKDSAAKGGADAGQAEVQETVDQAEDTGVLGEPVDPVPNEAYTVEGVTSGKGPETYKTDADAKDKDADKESKK